MANCITRHIPNAVTCCNLFSGCIASVMAFNENYTLAISFIILGAVFDFFDGMLARLFKVSGPLGKELDSLADDITFGFAPSAIVFSLFKEVHYPDFLLPVADYMPYTAFLISVFSALRLGKFNIDPRQSSSFIGMPTPANALFWGSLTVGAHSFLISDSFNAAFHLGSYYVIIAGGRNSNVLIKIQESCLETEQSQLYFPHCMYSPVGFLQNQQFCSYHPVVYHSISFN